MIYIAHRGNINGPNPKRENAPDYIKEALKKGYNVEVDVWYNSEEDQFYLGHNKPKYPIKSYPLERKSCLLLHNKVWCHAKQIEALIKLLDIGAHCFIHNQDECSLTSECYIWTPICTINMLQTKKLDDNYIVVMANKKIRSYEYNVISKYFGICNDYVGDIKCRLSKKSKQK